MSTSISLTYFPGTHSGVASASWRNSPEWITASEIFRRVLDLVHSRTFQISAEAVTVLSVFAAVAVWVFALQIFLGS
ncbi:hypothetical protein L6272_02370 [Microgenomates group bacterium]|nr:hypothetical protein [Microgenomates group bacterium]